MTTVNRLETVLRYAYLNGLTCEQWIVPTRECLEAGDPETEVCDLLLRTIFSFYRVSDPLLESYLTLATTQGGIISIETFISHLIPFGETTASRHPYPWSFILKLLSNLLVNFNSDLIVSDLQQGQNNPWVDILCDTFKMLSHIIAIGLYPDFYENSMHMSQTTFTSAISFQNSQPNFDSQFSFNSHESFNDPDATLDLENTQYVQDIDMKESTEAMPCLKKKNLIHVENASLAAQIMINLIEKKNAKRIFEVRNNQRRQAGLEINHEPWIQCQSKLELKHMKCPIATQNQHVQKLILLIQRLTDRDLERKMAVHMKYHELEDEGTARAMPSAGLMGLLYHMVQIRPSLDDDYIVDHLLKLQTIKGSFDESFYLELWLTALTGLREASLNTSCKGPPEDELSLRENKSCNSVAATNRLLWKSLVLVKLPFLLTKLQKNQDHITYEEDEMNPLESSLKELKSFTGLVNACSPPSCCSEFYAPDSMSSVLIDQIVFKKEKDEILDMMDEDEDITNSIQSISNHDIFTNIVQVCERHGFIRPGMAIELLKKNKNINTDPIEIIDQDLDQRFKAIRKSVTFSGLTELLHIGLVSSIHLRKVIDFILILLKEKSAKHDFFALSEICEALSECPCSVDLILQLYTPYELLGPLESICNHWAPSDSVLNQMNESTEATTGETTGQSTGESTTDLEGVQLLYNKFGKIWNLTVSVVKRFKLYRNMNKVFADKEGFVYQFFTQGPMIYGVDIQDQSKESFINQWMNALVGVDGLSDDLLLNSKPQDLLMIVPTIIQRCIILFSSQQIETESFTGMISYFQKKFLDFTLSGIILIVCEELLSGESSIALTCLRQLIMSDIALPREISLHPVLGSLESLLEFKRQETSFLTKEEEEKNLELAKGMSELTLFIMTNNKMDKLTEDHSLLHTETVTTNVTPNTLFEKAELMFKYIVKSGRSMFMSDVDADPNTLWDKNDNSKQQVVSHYLDMSLFETVLEIGGGHWFVSMIVDQVLEAGKSGGAVRAAELGSCLITTPLLYSVNTHNSCFNLLRCLLQDILPSILDECADQNMSFFQGQTLGVFTSDCLVLMHDRIDSVKKLGKWFFSALVIDNQSNTKNKALDHDQILEGTRFAEWDNDTTKSAVWRGFIKGLMSNPVIEEVWPNAFI